MSVTPPSTPVKKPLPANIHFAPLKNTPTRIIVRYSLFQPDNVDPVRMIDTYHDSFDSLFVTFVYNERYPEYLKSIQHSPVFDQLSSFATAYKNWHYEVQIPKDKIAAFSSTLSDYYFCQITPIPVPVFD
jgi:hypothetical protein